MQFEEGYLYHIYNQGNNRQNLFFERENYLFFLQKIGTHILPYADILAWCLMPNHFHLLLLVRNEILPVGKIAKVENTESFAQHNAESHTMTQSHRMTEYRKMRTFNDSIAIMLRSYTRAINNQQKRSGSLFKAHTKAECINCPNGISPSFYSENGITKINIELPEQQYPQICFDYIHQNPVKAKLVNNATDWEFSSAIDYAGLRNGKLINRELAKEYVLV